MGNLDSQPDFAGYTKREDGSEVRFVNLRLKEITMVRFE